jgi:TPR repeat protein
MDARSLFVVVILAGLLLAGTADGKDRIALVVGNSAYRNVAPLDNPKNDAALVARTLQELGFTLIGGGAQINLDKAALDRAVQSFSQRMQGADVALFYYAGHGVQIRGSNYLVPVDANPTREADVDFQMMDVNLVLRQMEGSSTRLNLVILDACRNNPFGSRGLRGTEPGLAQMRAPEGTLISYATQPGNVAQDGSDGDSPYTKALAATIRRPGLDIFQTFNEVGLAVERLTGGAQQPWTSSSPIDGNFYFSGPSAAAPEKAALVSPAAPSDPLRLDLITDCDRLAASPRDPSRPRGIEGVADNKVDIVPALTACREAMRQYPDVGRFAFEAGRIATLQGDHARARPLYEQAASLGSAVAMNNLGVLYMQGETVPKDPVRALKWFEMAANAGVPVAMANAGGLYLNTPGIPSDPAQARKWYERGAAAGQPRAMFGLGRLYEEGRGVPVDLGAARKWYERAAAADEPAAMNSLGNMYDLGTSVPKDYAAAHQWYEKAAALGNPGGMCNLGRMYQLGQGAPIDLPQARTWYEKGAATGDTICMRTLGALYERGQGVSRDSTLALQWYDKAAAAGDDAAKTAAQRLRASLH